jgi:hypothetical protein
MRGFSIRGLALAAVASLTIALCPATAQGAPVPAVPMLSASPDSLLVDGQPITVTASGYPLNHSLDLVQCVQDLGCDFSNLRVLFSGDTGGYVTTFSVHRLLTLDDGLVVDCAVAQNCVLVSLDITDLSTGAQTSIAFDPDAPVPPPLRFRMAPDPTGKVRLDKGVARITGTVHCNQPVQISADLMLEQIWHEHIFRSYSYVQIACSREGRFAAVFRPQDGLFGEGAAKLHIDAFGYTSTNYELVKNVMVTLVPSTA